MKPLPFAVCILLATFTALASEPAPRPPVAAKAEAKSQAIKVSPLEHVREKLALRLAAVKSGGNASPYELQVPVKAPLAAATKKSKAVAYEAPHWAYQGEAGPQAWGGLKAEFGLCQTGQRQSPIDIRDGFAVDLEPVRFDYQTETFSVIDNGHTVQVNVEPGSVMHLGGRRFELQQFHFHRPSEERIAGRQFDMVVHLVHKDSEGRLVVVAVLLDKGSAQPVVQTVWNNLPLEKHQDVKSRARLNLNDLLPADRRYYTYMGSLTTPPCSEGVQWVVMRQPVEVSAEQIELFSRLYPMNARPVQASSGRRIMQSN
jgi:carbonic anhydrase